MFLSLTAVLVLSAGCDGSLNGGPDAFTTWSDVDPSSMVRIEGIGRVVQYHSDSVGAVSTGAPKDADVYVSWGVDAAGNLNALAAKTDLADPFGEVEPLAAGVNFDVGAGDTIAKGSRTFGARDFLIATTANDDEFAAFTDAASQSFEHQSFGIWANGLNAGTGVFGAASVGSVTAVSGIPTSGVAYYAGSATGVFVDATGTDFFTFSDFGAKAEFGISNNLFVSTSDTAAVNVTNGVSTPMPQLNFVGIGPTNQPFSVQITNNPASVPPRNVDPVLTGTLSGRFYGPKAEELGGTFLMTGSASWYMGAVGASQ